jgi:hypothetical protein
VRAPSLNLFVLPLALLGCSLSLPVKLYEMTDVKSSVRVESRDAPRMTLALHPDGLGWQVFLNQSVTRETVTEADEHWQYRDYDLSGRSSPERPRNYDDLCAVLLLTTPILAPLNVEGPPYWTRWERLTSACNSSPVNSSRILHDRGPIREETGVSVEAVTVGHLSLIWRAPGQLPIAAHVPLLNNTKSTGTAVRLRWLAEMIRRTARSPVMLESGTVELQFIHQDRTVVRKTLPVSPADLVTSLRDDRIIFAPPEHWPRELIIRIESDSQSLSEKDRAHLRRQTAITLNRLALPVVLRGDELERWRADQAHFHRAQFGEMSSIDPAHAVGATVLLHLAVRAPFTQSRVLTIYAVSIATGEVLAKLSAGGHESQWPFVVEMSMRELDLMLQHLLDHVAARPVGTNPGLETRP